MKKVLFTLVALMMAGSLCAEEYLYVDDFTVASEQLGTTITVPVKAHFENYLNGFQVDMTMPEGMTIVGAYAGPDMSIDYINAAGQAAVYNSRLYLNLDYNRFIAANSEAGYWQVDGQWQMYGAVKWLGDYDEMFFIQVQVASNFQGGNLTVKSDIASGYDNRGPIAARATYFKTAAIDVSGSGGVTPVDPDPVNIFSMPDMNLTGAGTIRIPVSMTNTDKITAFQTDIYLPAGFELVEVDDEYDITLSDRAADHVLMSHMKSDGIIRIICYSPNLMLFSGNSGELFYLNVRVPEGASGNYEIMLKNSEMSNSNHNLIYVPDACCELTVTPFIAGDANNSGTITVSDVVTTAMFILDYDPAPFDFMSADMNEDGTVSVTDVVIISGLVLGAPAPAKMRAMGPVTDVMSGNHFSIESGETRTVSIMLDNELDYSAFQFEMSLPEGLTASNFCMTDRAGDHMIDAVPVDNGKVRVLAYSPSLQSIEGNRGTVLTFDVTANGVVNGEISANSVEMVTALGQTVRLGKFAFQVNGTTGAKTLTVATRIYSDGCNVVVETPADVTVTISDMMGRARNVNVKAGRTVIPVDHAGVYVVSAAGQTAKMSLR